jgi:cell division protein FtsQ
MKQKSNILKMLLLGFWLLAGAGSIVLLVSAIKGKKGKDCQGLQISIKGKTDQYFFDEKDIGQLITIKGTHSIKGKEIRGFDLNKLEKILERNPWVRDAELYFDNNQILQVKVWQREPIARIFTALGNSFYIDSAAARLPLSDKFSARLPVFTNFPSEKEKFTRKDSPLVADIKKISFFLLENQFWMSQITQIDIHQSQQFEMIPMIGNHVIEFGGGDKAAEKFGKLMVFYRQVLARTGMDRYSRLKLQYSKQVIGVKREGMFSKQDSIQATRSVEQLIASIHKSGKSFSVADSFSINPLKDHRPFESKTNPDVAKKGSINSKQ